MTLEEGISHIREVTINITELNDSYFNYKDNFVYLSMDIQNGKLGLRHNSIRFVLANILDQVGQPRNLNYTGYFELIVVGDFGDRLRLVEEVAESLTNFYIETEILPRIRSINENYLIENIERYDDLLKKTIKLYDREKNIF